MDAVRVDAAPRVAHRERRHEERCTGRGLQDGRFAQVGLAGVVHYEEVGWLHEFFLHARWREEDVFAMADRGSTACTCYLVQNVSVVAAGVSKRRGLDAGGVYPAVSVEFPAQFADEIGGVIWIVRCD